MEFSYRSLLVASVLVVSLSVQQSFGATSVTGKQLSGISSHSMAAESTERGSFLNLFLYPIHGFDWDIKFT